MFICPYLKSYNYLCPVSRGEYNYIKGARWSSNAVIAIRTLLETTSTNHPFNKEGTYNLNLSFLFRSIKFLRNRFLSNRSQRMILIFRQHGDEMQFQIISSFSNHRVLLP